MYDCVPLFVPSNLGDTKLNISISADFDNIALDVSGLQGRHKGYDKTYSFEGYFCFVRGKTVEMAQPIVNRLSKQLEKHPLHPIHSDRLYLLPLFAKVAYHLSVTQDVHHERPVIRIEYCPEKPLWPWLCKIYASNLVQLQEALFFHERNLLKKRLQVLNQQTTAVLASEQCRYALDQNIYFAGKEASSK